MSDPHSRTLRRTEAHQLVMTYQSVQHGNSDADEEEAEIVLESEVQHSPRQHHISAKRSEEAVEQRGGVVFQSEFLNQSR